MEKKAPTSWERLLEAIEDLHSQEQIVTRETLAAHAGIAGFTKTQLDDRLSWLENHGHIVRVQRGVYVPAQRHPPARQVYAAVCPDGTWVLEVGETKLVLTPREARNVGMVMAGAGQQFVAIEIGHQMAQANGSMAHKLREIGRKVDQIEAATGGQDA